MLLSNARICAQKDFFAWTSGEADGSSRSLPGAVVLADHLFISGQKDCVSVSEMNTWLPGSSHFEAYYIQMSMSYTDVSELLVEFLCTHFAVFFPKPSADPTPVLV